MANIGTVRDAKTVLDIRLESRSLRVVGQGASQAQRCAVGLAKQQWQWNVPIDIGHWRCASPVKLGGVSKAFLNEV
jgi:hypothetical protein